MLEVQLPDGTIVEHPESASALDVAAKIGSRLAKAVVAAKIDDKVVDATRPLKDLTEQTPVPLTLLTDRDAAALDVLRHSSAHIMARAVMRLYDGVSLAFGPTINNGFYYDFEVDEPFTEDDLLRVMNINVSGVWRCCKAVIPHMRDGGGGSIVNIASLAAAA